ncbi:hypothetical protein [Nitrososphaera sp.]|uniref:hypothetical protein n=1 Tax=Nitrososphaera sp. TaxID=1971748 RepID=UPI00179F0087|nr:hypothetical protein [Nitrososphaera sp.]NWG36696.1 hypothetical protein [Nitrososphaera sp.]
MAVMVCLPTYAANPSFNSTKAFEYIASNYNSTYGLVRENENTDRYWLWTDNILASHVLKDYDYAKATNITSTIRHYNELYDLDFRHPVGSLFDQVAFFNSLTDKNVVNNIWISDSDGSVELECSDYGDIAFYKSIYYYKAGKVANARSCYDKGVNMFDGIGIRDKAFAADGQRYSSYKIALWKIASNITGFGEAKDALTIISYMQNSTTGGVYTHYRADMLPDSQTNVETTSLAILAYKGMAFSDGIAKPVDGSDVQLPVLLVGMFIVLGFAIILLKRFRK